MQRERVVSKPHGHNGAGPRARRAAAHHQQQTSAEQRLGDVVRRVKRARRELMNRMQAEMRTRPEMTLATVGGVSFIAGALFGNRLGRAVMYAVLPYAIGRVVKGQLGPKLQEYIQELISSLGDIGGQLEARGEGGRGEGRGGGR